MTGVFVLLYGAGAACIGCIMAATLTHPERGDRWKAPEIIAGAMVWPIMVTKFIGIGFVRLYRREFLPKPKPIKRLPVAQTSSWDNWQEKQRGGTIGRRPPTRSPGNGHPFPLPKRSSP